MALTCQPTTAGGGNGLLSLKFNQDQSCLAVATTSGFCVWNTEPFTLRYRRDLGAGVGLATVLFRSNIAILAGGGDNPRFQDGRAMVWDDHLGQAIAELPFNSTVRGIEMTADAIAIALDGRTSVYDFSGLVNIMHTQTVDNPRGLVDIRASGNGAVDVIATLTTKVGHVAIHYTDNRAPSTIAAHEMPIARLALNADGSLLATTSEKGTVVRVWDTASGEKRVELRRGKDPALISTLSFSRDSRWLAVSSDRGTVHIFDLDAPAPTSPTGLLQYIGSTGVLGAGVSDYSTGRTSKATIHRPSPAPACVCAFGSEPGRLLVADAEGVYTVYAFDLAKGGEARIIKRSVFGAGTNNTAATNNGESKA
ncbi:WD40-repeat containing protein [Pandoravirus salinus]|uniref:WD40-repeat containing protein n=1 Tax=Pandoravirus salinus TaxID=1349410 RepID=S4W562_9VIRU|nr:WD40-repeat-containing protein [Pandoravirus salinus]AGO85892.1 WD40-repeat containing protein [Pandoravirus salinus]